MSRLQELIERDQWAELLIDSKRISDLSRSSDIEVLAFSHKEAIKKAVEIFDIDSRYFICEETTKGLTGLFGWFRTPSRYIITLKPEAKDMLAPASDYESNESAKNKNGSFRIIMRKTGLELIVFAPSGIGTPATIHDIEHDLESKGIVKYDKTKVLHAVQEPGTKVTVAPYVHSDYDATFTVYLDKSNMSAYFSFSMPKIDSSMISIDNTPLLGRVPDTAEVVNALKKIGVRLGINEATIQEVLDNGLHSIPVIVAEGIPVEHGKNGYLEYTFPTGEEQFKHAVMPDGSVNFRELNIIHNVRKGDILAIMHPPTPGIVGRNLLGETIQPNPGKEVALNIGDNVTISGNGLQAIAASMGQVYLKNNKICVDTALEIGGDLDLSVGNIDFIGNVIIKGNVDDGFTIISGGNIEIHGHIGKSFIRAQGNIIAHKGIQGKDEATIECVGNLYAKFIERAQLNIGSNIFVTDYILHSNITCNDNVIVAGGKRSIIAGGHLKVQNCVYVTQAGAESYIDTFIEVGYASKIQRELKALEIFIKEKAQQIETMKSEIDNLGRKLPPARLVKLEQKIVSLQDQHNKAVSTMGQLHLQITQIQAEAFLSVEKRMMPGVKLQISDVILENSAEQTGGSYHKKDKQIVANNYIAPKLFEVPTLKPSNKR